MTPDFALGVVAGFLGACLMVAIFQVLENRQRNKLLLKKEVTFVTECPPGTRPMMINVACCPCGEFATFSLLRGPRCSRHWNVEKPEDCKA